MILNYLSEQVEQIILFIGQFEKYVDKYRFHYIGLYSIANLIKLKTSLRLKALWEGSTEV